jgi:hypothetical protein
MCDLRRELVLRLSFQADSGLYITKITLLITENVYNAILPYLLAPFSYSLLPTIFSTAKTTPSLPRMPIAVPLFSTAFSAYSIWKVLEENLVSQMAQHVFILF